MHILDIIKSRRSVRSFVDREIPAKAIDGLVEALLWAPSAGNLQSRRFYFVFNEAVRRKLAMTEFRGGLAGFIAHAPLVVVACVDYHLISPYRERGRELYCIQDAAASIQNMMLVAQDLGLGSCWVGAFKEEQVESVLGLPDHLRPVALIPVGYPARTPKTPGRVPKTSAVTIVR